MNKHDLIRKVASLTGEKIGTVERVLPWYLCKPRLNSAPC
jgi:hypothetical protein